MNIKQSRASSSQATLTSGAAPIPGRAQGLAQQLEQWPCEHARQLPTGQTHFKMGLILPPRDKLRPLHLLAKKIFVNYCLIENPLEAEAFAGQAVEVLVILGHAALPAYPQPGWGPLPTGGPLTPKQSTVC